MADEPENTETVSVEAIRGALSSTPTLEQVVARQVRAEVQKHIRELRMEARRREPEAPKRDAQLQEALRQSELVRANQELTIQEQARQLEQKEAALRELRQKLDGARAGLAAIATSQRELDVGSG